jgi:hypothetical protein
MFAFIAWENTAQTLIEFGSRAPSIDSSFTFFTVGIALVDLSIAATVIFHLWRLTSGLRCFRAEHGLSAATAVMVVAAAGKIPVTSSDPHAMSRGARQLDDVAWRLCVEANADRRKHH